MRKRAIIVTPVFPVPERGADQSDRANGIRQLKRLGYEVTVISKVWENADQDFLQGAARSLDVRLITVPYRYGRPGIRTSRRVIDMMGKLLNPLYLDGAAYEYAEQTIQDVLAKEMSDSEYDLAWFDYTYLWPLYHIPKKHGVPIVTRAMNFEPAHFLEEDGVSVLNLFKYVPKLISELIVILKSDLVVTLSPHEDSVYRRWGARRTVVVPLRGLCRVLRETHPIRDGRPLHVFFMGSTYTVAHNERALDLVTGTVAPRAAKEIPGEFVFHVSGAKMPEKYASRFDGKTLINEGFIDMDAFDAYMDRMDIAISPSPKRVGMQQKVYEPLARGIPLVTHPCNVGGYPFESGKHYIPATDANEYFDALLSLRSSSKRTELSRHSSQTASALFSEKVIDTTLRDALREHTARR